MQRTLNEKKKKSACRAFKIIINKSLCIMQMTSLFSDRDTAVHALGSRFFFCSSSRTDETGNGDLFTQNVCWVINIQTNCTKEEKKITTKIKTKFNFIYGNNLFILKTHVLWLLLNLMYAWVGETCLRWIIFLFIRFGGKVTLIDRNISSVLFFRFAFRFIQILGCWSGIASVGRIAKFIYFHYYSLLFFRFCWLLTEIQKAIHLSNWFLLNGPD